MSKPLLGRILLATDFSDCARRALDYARFLAEAGSARLEVVYVQEFPPGMDPDYAVNVLYLERLRKEIDQQLDDLVREATGGGSTSSPSRSFDPEVLDGAESRGRIAVTARQLVGIASQKIVDAARESEVDLVVVGTHGRSGLEHILLGSTAERVIRTAPCPVLAVRVPRQQADLPAASIAIRSILAPVDFSDCSLEALEYAAALAQPFKASVTILHVLEPVSFGLDFTLRHAEAHHQARAAWEARLADLTAALRDAGIQAGSALRGALPAESILDCAKEINADVIVMGTHGRRGLSNLVSGSVAEAVLRKAECPVLAVKSPKFRPGHQRLVSTMATSQKGGSRTS